jgi:hypothetical protein
MIVTRQPSGLANSALADNARDRPRAEGCAEHPGMRKQLLTGTNSISAQLGGSACVLGHDAAGEVWVDGHADDPTAWWREGGLAYWPVNRNSACHGPSAWTTSQ